MNFAETKEELLLTACIDKHEQSSAIWYLDSGCNNHMSGNKVLFFDLDKTFRENMKLENNFSISVLGKGKIKIMMNNSMMTITSVLYVLELKSNLISLGQLQEKGFDIIIQKGCYQIYHPN
ncbi:hypothetical protein Pint_33443 [Pistacia integerrima]|uniref:Uncharacterized protein n=1 Tax=Pistacia integerrima TaxID=434235 RepID=A0ACC0X4Y0_9ROSI|nr:hypothetical protein Pint_33443 [Pistacia integerrima]